MDLLQEAVLPMAKPELLSAFMIIVKIIIIMLLFSLPWRTMGTTHHISISFKMETPCLGP